MNEKQAVEPANDDDLGTDTDTDTEIELADAEEIDTPSEDVTESDEAEDTSDEKPEDTEAWQANIRLVEALIFASAEPLTERMLANRLPEGADVKGLLKALQLIYEDRGVNLVRAGSSWAFRTAPDLAELLNKEVEVARKMSRAAIETLAIIAYHQPVTRAEIEEIRGVSISKGTLDVLLEEEWIKPRGRRQTPGRPLQWGTTDFFLDHFGLETVRDLPGLDELKAAGLLDASPAINAYRATAEIMGELPQEGDDEETDEEPLPDDPLEITEEPEDEPLDPEGDR